MRGTGEDRRRAQQESFSHAGGESSVRGSVARSFNSRLSDISYGSSHPSSPSSRTNRTAVIPISDRSYQNMAIQAINAYLSSHSHPHSLPLSLTNKLPSAKAILETLRFVLGRLQIHCTRIEDDLLLVLKYLNCPIKLNKSALRAPGTPHSWPSLLGVIHWLVQLEICNEHFLNASTTGPSSMENPLFQYTLDCYQHYLRGEDDVVDSLDKEFSEKIDTKKESAMENLRNLEKQARDLEAELEELRLQPCPREALENEKVVLEEDAKKFHAVIDQFSSQVASADKVLEEKIHELRVKEDQVRKTNAENDELKKDVEAQKVNFKDAERMNRDLQDVRREIEELEGSRNTWEEKTRDLDRLLRHMRKEIEEHINLCNQSMRGLKFAEGCQYVLNEKGSTHIEVLGIDFNSILKPAIKSFSNDLKGSSLAKLEEKMLLQQQCAEISAENESIEEKIDVLQSQVDQAYNEINILKKKNSDEVPKYKLEASKLREDIELKARNIEALKKEAAESLQIIERKNEESIKRNEEEYDKCYNAMFRLVDRVSKHKEFVSNSISEMEVGLSETAAYISNTFNKLLPGNDPGGERDDSFPSLPKRIRQSSNLVDGCF